MPVALPLNLPVGRLGVLYFRCKHSFALKKAAYAFNITHELLRNLTLPFTNRCIITKTSVNNTQV